MVAESFYVETNEGRKFQVYYEYNKKGRLEIRFELMGKRIEDEGYLTSETFKLISSINKFKESLIEKKLDEILMNNMGNINYLENETIIRVFK